MGNFFTNPFKAHRAVAQNILPKNSLGGKLTQSQSMWGTWVKQPGAVKQAPQGSAIGNIMQQVMAQRAGGQPVSQAPPPMTNAGMAPPPRGMPVASGQGYRPGMQAYADGGKVKKRKKRVDERSKYVKKGCKK